MRSLLRKYASGYLLSDIPTPFAFKGVGQVVYGRVVADDIFYSFQVSIGHCTMLPVLSESLLVVVCYIPRL